VRNDVDEAAVFDMFLDYIGCLSGAFEKSFNLLLAFRDEYP